MTLPAIPHGDDWAAELVGVLFDPVIVYPAGGYENDLSEWIMSQISLERIIMNTKIADVGRGVPVGDTEVLAYIYPWSLCGPLGDQWTRIYKYVFTQALKFRKLEAPESLHQDALSDYDMERLDAMKVWIYKQRLAHRDKKRREKDLKAIPVQKRFFQGDDEQCVAKDFSFLNMTHMTPSLTLETSSPVITQKPRSTACWRNLKTIQKHSSFCKT